MTGSGIASKTRFRMMANPWLTTGERGVRAPPHFLTKDAAQRVPVCAQDLALVEYLVPKQELDLAAQVGSQHFGAVRVYGVHYSVRIERFEDPLQVSHTPYDPCVHVRRWTHLQSYSLLSDEIQRPLVLDGPDPVANSIWFEIFDYLSDRVVPLVFSGMDS